MKLSKAQNGHSPDDKLNLELSRYELSRYELSRYELEVLFGTTFFIGGDPNSSHRRVFNRLSKECREFGVSDRLSDPSVMNAAGPWLYFNKAAEGDKDSTY